MLSRPAELAGQFQQFQQQLLGRTVGTSPTQPNCCMAHGYAIRLGGWNGEFHFYTGPPSNRSRNLLISEGALYLQPDLTSNFKPTGHTHLNRKCPGEPS